MTPKISLRRALADPAVLGGALVGPSWDAWRIMLLTVMGEPRRRTSSRPSPGSPAAPCHLTGPWARRPSSLPASRQGSSVERPSGVHRWPVRSPRRAGAWRDSGCRLRRRRSITGEHSASLHRGRVPGVAIVAADVEQRYPKGDRAHEWRAHRGAVGVLPSAAGRDGDRGDLFGGAFGLTARLRRILPKRFGPRCGLRCSRPAARCA